MLIRTCCALAAASMLSGCIAAVAAPGLLLGGGSWVGANALVKGKAAESERQVAAAMAIDPNLNPRAIKVSRATVDGTTVRWTAELPRGTRYACSQAKGYKTATCVPDPSSTARN